LRDGQFRRTGDQGQNNPANIPVVLQSLWRV
jgi:hypothetical protein